MKKTAQRVAALAIAALSTVGIGLVSREAGAQTAPSTSSAPAKIQLRMADSRLGSIMVDGKGMTLYMFAPDRRNVSNCAGPCLAAWPPLKLAAGQNLDDVDTTGTALRRSLLGIAVEPDGTRQLTYNGWPLYYWFRDARPGDVNGQWVTNNWWVLNEHGVPNLAR